MRVSDHNIIIADMITCVYDNLICKLVPPLLRNLCYHISSNIALSSTNKVSSQTHVFKVNDHQKDHSLINYVCHWHAVQILKWQHYQKCDFYADSVNIAGKLRKLKVWTKVKASVIYLYVIENIEIGEGLTYGEGQQDLPARCWGLWDRWRSHTRWSTAWLTSMLLMTLRKVKAMPPPMIISLTLSRRLSISRILSATFALPTQRNYQL